MDKYGIVEIRRCFTEHQTYLAQEEKNSQIFCGELDFISSLVICLRTKQERLYRTLRCPVVFLYYHHSQAP